MRLLLARGVDVNAAETFQKTTALMWASAEGHIEVADLLIEAGADVNRQAHITSLTDRHNADHPTGGFTALMFAARAGNDALVRKLVARGANINLKNGDAASAAMVAIYNDRFDVAGHAHRARLRRQRRLALRGRRDARRDDRSVRVRRVAAAARITRTS